MTKQWSDIPRLDQLPDVLTVPEVAEVLRMGKNSIYGHLRRGDIPSVRMGKRILIPKAGVVRFLEHVLAPQRE